MPITYKEDGSIKRPNMKIAYDKAMLANYAACSKSVKYFAENYYYIIDPVEGKQIIELRDYQLRILENFEQNRFNILLSARQIGKAENIETPIMTPTGFKKLGDLQVGDVIYGRDGKKTNITFITPTMYDRDVYEIIFDNGERIQADAEHLWQISYSDHDKETILTTKEILDIRTRLDKRTKPGQIRIKYIENPLDFDESIVDIHPYVLGMWLGDGNSDCGQITCTKEDYEHYKPLLTNLGYSIGRFKPTKNSTRCGRFLIEGLTTRLRKAGLLYNKHIPKNYIFNSVEVRHELLKGLMDTDGYCNKASTCQFDQSHEEIANDVRLLLSTLGIKSTIRRRKTKRKDSYQITFCTQKMEVFTLQRKLIRQRMTKGHQQNTHIYVQSITKVESVPVRCLQVDNEDHLFLCGKTLIPTHNTTCSAAYILWYCCFNADKTVAILANKADTAKSILSEIKMAYELLPAWLKPGVVEYNAFNVKFDNGCTILAKATSPDALRGEAISLLFLDEFAFVPQNFAEDFWQSNYPTLSTGGACIIVSTPNGTSNLFYKLWKDALDKNNTFNPIKVEWHEVPGRTEKWKEETIKNIGIIRFNQEYGCQFHGSSVTLINADFLVNKMKWKDPVLNPDDSTFIWSMPQPGRKYLVSIDTAGGVGSDFSVMNIFDITDYPYGKAVQCALWRNNTTRPPQFAEMVYHAALQWNNAYVIGEINGLSNEVINRLIEDFEYENIFYDYDDDIYGVYSDKASKRHAAVWFKEELEQEHIEISDSFTITELGYFEEVTPGVYRAKAGRSLHDDCVITCLWLVYFLKSKYFLDIIDEWKLEEIKQKDVQDFVESEASESEQLDFEENLHSFIERDNEEYDENWLDREEN